MIEDQGLMKDVSYRPSRTTKIKYLASSLLLREQDLAIALAGGEVDGEVFGNRMIPEQEKRKIC
ncbi:MAG: hypothetical protein MZV70_57565 [Desulfobacterales bacterium]|nr:hypothetical protein [Desulfobacterales bacterium]